MTSNAVIQIRNVPEEARRALKARAAAEGRSLNSYLLTLIEREVARRPVADVLARAASRSERSTTSAARVLQAARTEREAELTRRQGRR